MKSQFWLEQYHTTIDKKNTAYTEVVDKVPAYETMLYYFIYVISSHQHTFQMSGNTQISVHTSITPSVGITVICSLYARHPLDHNLVHASL